MLNRSLICELINFAFLFIGVPIIICINVSVLELVFSFSTFSQTA